MILLVLPFVSARAFATVHYVLFTQCIDMNRVVLLLEDAMAHLTLKFRLLASHIMRSQTESLDHSLAVLTLHWHKGTVCFVLSQLSFSKHSCAPIFFARALFQVKVAGPLMIQDLGILHNVLAARVRVLASKG